MPPVMIAKLSPIARIAEAGEVDAEVLQVGAAREQRVLRREDREGHDHRDDDADLGRVDETAAGCGRAAAALRPRRRSSLRRLDCPPVLMLSPAPTAAAAMIALLGELQSGRTPAAMRPVLEHDDPVADARAAPRALTTRRGSPCPSLAPLRSAGRSRPSPRRRRHASARRAAAGAASAAIQRPKIMRCWLPPESERAGCSGVWQRRARTRRSRRLPALGPRRAGSAAPRDPAQDRRA